MHPKTNTPHVLLDMTVQKGGLSDLVHAMDNAAAIAELHVNDDDGSFHVIVTGTQDTKLALEAFDASVVEARRQRPNHTQVTFTADKDGLLVAALSSVDPTATVLAALDEVFKATYADGKVYRDMTETSIAIYSGSTDAKRALFAKDGDMGTWRQISEFCTKVEFAVTDDGIGSGHIGDTKVMAAPIREIKRAVRSDMNVNWDQMADLPAPLAYFGRGKDKTLIVNLTGEHGIDCYPAQLKTEGDSLKFILDSDGAVRSDEADKLDDVVIGMTGAFGDTLAFRGNGQGPSFRGQDQVPAPLWQLAAHAAGMGRRPESAREL